MICKKCGSKFIENVSLLCPFCGKMDVTSFLLGRCLIAGGIIGAIVLLVSIILRTIEFFAGQGTGFPAGESLLLIVSVAYFLWGIVWFMKQFEGGK